MAIGRKWEVEMQKIMARAKGIIVEDAVIYAIGYPYETLRYIEGERHLTGSWGLEYTSEPWYYWYSTVARWLFAPKGAVIHFKTPLCWDDKATPISEDDQQAIFSRIKRALGYKRCRFVLEPAKQVMKESQCGSQFQVHSIDAESTA